MVSAVVVPVPSPKSKPNVQCQKSDEAVVVLALPTQDDTRSQSVELIGAQSLIRRTVPTHGISRARKDRHLNSALLFGASSLGRSSATSTSTRRCAAWPVARLRHELHRHLALLRPRHERVPARRRPARRAARPLPARHEARPLRRATHFDFSARAGRRERRRQPAPDGRRPPRHHASATTSSSSTWRRSSRRRCRRCGRSSSRARCGSSASAATR